MFIPVGRMQTQGAVSVYENARCLYQFGECSHVELYISPYENAKCWYQFGECSHRELSVYMGMLNVHTSFDNAVIGNYQSV